MPITLRPKDTILDSIISSILAGNVVSDINPISFTRQLSEGVAATQADLDYSLYTMLQGWYITTAEGVDLDIRGNDQAVPRDPGQQASDPVTFTKETTAIDDIPLPAPQVVQATLADGTQVLYRSVGNAVLEPSGRSISGQAPATTLTSGTNDTLTLNIDSDGARTVTLGTQTTATGIAAAIQAAVQALTAINPSQQQAYNDFRCDYAITTPGAYTLRSGLAGPSSSVMVTVAATLDASAALKLGLASGGVERVGQGSLAIPVICDTIGVLGNVGAGQINTLVGNVPGIDSVSNALMFSNGREPASDDAYRQDIRRQLDALGRGGQASIEVAVQNTLGADGQRHVMTSQVVCGAGTIQVYVCDGRSLTVGAQTDVIQDVQDELDGLGEMPGGWVAGGNVAGVVSATVLTVDIDVDVSVGSTPDLVRAKQAVTNALYTFLYQSGVGQLLTLVQLDGVIDSTVVEVFNIVYRLPTAFSVTPAGTIGGSIGTKLMPGRITVTMLRV
jgi:uncharacterized phage protein gp47/JayE